MIKNNYILENKHLRFKFFFSYSFIFQMKKLAIMHKKKLIKRLNELNKFTKSKDKTQFICKCPDETIHCLCELCLNFLNGNILILKNNKISVFERLILHYLADSAISVIEKRKILNLVSKILFPILQKKVIPALKKQIQLTK